MKCEKLCTIRETSPVVHLWSRKVPPIPLWVQIHSVLYTDHKPFTAIFGAKKGIPPLAAAPLQQWITERTFQTLYLSGYPILKIYKQNQAIIIYNTTTNQNTFKESIATVNELAGIESLTDHNWLK